MNGNVITFCRWQAVVLALFLGATAVRADPPASAPAASSRPADGVVRIRFPRLRYDKNSWMLVRLMQRAQEEFAKKNPWVVFEQVEGAAETRQGVEKLTQGKLDVAFFIGPVAAPSPSRPSHTPPRQNDEHWLPIPTGRGDELVASLAKGKCPTSILGWRVLAVTVHPQHPWNEVDEVDLRRILSRKAISWKGLGGPDKPIRRVFDGRTIRTLRRLTPRAYNNRLSAAEIYRLLASDPHAIGFLATQKRLIDSGLKIVPVRAEHGGPALLPSRDNVLSGKYPYCDYLLVAVRPDAPQIVREFHAFLKEAVPEGKLVSANAWPKLEEVSSLLGKEEIWPLPSPKATRFPVSGAVAVLPLASRTGRLFLLNEAHHVLYEKNVAQGISRDGRLSMVDRAELIRILDEYKLDLAQGAGSQQGRSAQGLRASILTADVLVMSQVVTEGSRHYLCVSAVHAATTACLGRMRLPIDLAKPFDFHGPLATRVAQWWPGVLENLVAARSTPVWTVVPARADNPSDREVCRQVTDALQKALASDKRAFLADYTMVPDAQREVFLQVLGVSRPSVGRFTVAADYLIDLHATADGKIRLRLLRGTDLATLAETTSKRPATAHFVTWLERQISALAKNPTDPTVSAQFDLVFQRASQLKKQLRAFRTEAYQRYRAQGLPTYTAEDAKELQQFQAEVDRAFERATHLDPTHEAAAYEAAVPVFRKSASTFPGLSEQAETADRFIDAFPNSPHHREMLNHAFYAHYTLARLAERAQVRDSEFVYFSQGLDPIAVTKHHRRRALSCANDRVRRYPSDDADSTMDHYNLCLKQYMGMAISDEEREEVLVEYGLAIEARPELGAPADFWRLRRLAEQGKKEAYVEVLASMQHRWPDPADPHWKHGKDQALQDLCRLFKVDRRSTSFYRWLRGKRGIGDLPWEGYDPKESQ